MVIQILMNAGILPGLNDFQYYPSNFFWLQSKNLLGVWKHRDKSLSHSGIVAESYPKRKWIEPTVKSIWGRIYQRRGISPLLQTDFWFNLLSVSSRGNIAIRPGSIFLG